MRWLEGWFGVASGVLGIIILALISVFVPASQAQSNGSCTTVGSSTTCYGTISDSGPAGSIQPNYPALILIAIALLIFVGVLVGVWLDLSGRRRSGRAILATSGTFLLLSIFTAGGAVYAYGTFVGPLLYPISLMGLVAGILACVRRDEPRVALVGTPAQPPTQAHDSLD